MYNNNNNKDKTSIIVIRYCFCGMKFIDCNFYSFVYMCTYHLMCMFFICSSLRIFLLSRPKHLLGQGFYTHMHTCEHAHTHTKDTKTISTALPSIHSLCSSGCVCAPVHVCVCVHALYVCCSPVLLVALANRKH